MSAPNGRPTVSRGTDDKNIRDGTEQPVRSAKSRGKLSSDRCTVPWGYTEHGLGTDRYTPVASNLADTQ
jgi:hypothetical protein